VQVPSQNQRKGLSTSVIAVIIIVIIVAGVGGGYYFFFYKASTTQSIQTFSFAEEALTDPSHAVSIDALNHLSSYGLAAQYSVITDPTALTSAASSGQIDMFDFQFPTTTINGIEKGANVIGIGQESTSFLQDLVVTSNVTSFQQLNGTTMAAFQLDGPVLFPSVWASVGLNYSHYNINLVVLGSSTVKAQALIAGKYIGAFLDPSDAAAVFKANPGKFHILATTAAAFPALGGTIFANKSWFNTHFQIAVDFLEAMLQSARNATAHLQTWVNATWNANYTGVDYKIYNSTQYIYQQADYFSPNMITFTPTLMNGSDNFMFFGGLINSSGDVNQIYNFSAAQAALKALGTVPEPTGPFQTYQPLALIFSPFSSGVPGVLDVSPIYVVKAKY
jgi:ABC-type nitrate/sulfonate/bicarbonate transport system substrate-binding protein